MQEPLSNPIRLLRALDKATTRCWQQLLNTNSEAQLKKLEVRYFLLVTELKALQDELQRETG